MWLACVLLGEWRTRGWWGWGWEWDASDGDEGWEGGWGGAVGLSSLIDDMRADFFAFCEHGCCFRETIGWLMGRSGPKRLGRGRCGATLIAPNLCETQVSRAVPHPHQGRCLSTLVMTDCKV